MNSAALNAAEKGDYEDARAQFAIVAERASELGARDLVAFVAVNLSEVAWLSGDFHSAIEQATAALPLFRDCGDEGGILACLVTCSWSALAIGDPARAAEFLRPELAIAGRLGARRRVFLATSGLAAAHVGMSEEERGARSSSAPRRRFGRNSTSACTTNVRSCCVSRPSRPRRRRSARTHSPQRGPAARP